MSGHNRFWFHLRSVYPEEELEILLTMINSNPKIDILEWYFIKDSHFDTATGKFVYPLELDINSVLRCYLDSVAVVFLCDYKELPLHINDSDNKFLSCVLNWRMRIGR